MSLHLNLNTSINLYLILFPAQVPENNGYVTASFQVPATGYVRIQAKDPNNKFGAYIYSEGELNKRACSMLYSAGQCLDTKQQVHNLDTSILLNKARIVLM